RGPDAEERKALREQCEGDRDEPDHDRAEKRAFSADAVLDEAEERRARGCGDLEADEEDDRLLAREAELRHRVDRRERDHDLDARLLQEEGEEEPEEVGQGAALRERVAELAEGGVDRRASVPGPLPSPF